MRPRITYSLHDLAITDVSGIVQQILCRPSSRCIYRELRFERSQSKASLNDKKSNQKVHGEMMTKGAAGTGAGQGISGLHLCHWGRGCWRYRFRSRAGWSCGVN